MLNNISRIYITMTVFDFKSSALIAIILPSQSGKEWSMKSGRMIFSQLINFLPKHELNKCVRRYQGNYRVRRFSCFDQFLCMVNLFAKVIKRSFVASAADDCRRQE